MNVAEFVMEFLAERMAVGDVFMVSGGGIMYLVDALAVRASPGYWCNYHETGECDRRRGIRPIARHPRGVPGDDGAGGRERAIGDRGRLGGLDPGDRHFGTGTA